MEDVTEEFLLEFDSENVAQNLVTEEEETEENVARDGPIVPEVGMIFKDEKELLEFYKRYAYDVGFPVRKRNSKKGENGVLKYVTLTCSREGRRISNSSGSFNPPPISQIDCKARISASSDKHGRWRINTIHLDHNHATSPSKSRLYRCNRELSANVKRKLEVNDLAGIPFHKSYNSAVVEAGGYENMTCVEKDCRNYIDQVRRLRLGEGDAAAIQSYFSKMQARCSGFYFSMDVDDESRLKNVFWSDKRCRQAYKEFGDVVTFDTTYLTNKYDMPFAPFVGVNHHGQSTLFGCGLLSNEDTDTFVWLFKTWLQCMHGQAPHGIITDQDKAMQNAIEIVFPDTKHRWCLWHILKKLPEKFGYHVDKSSIFSTIHHLVYDSQIVEEFEASWKQMIHTYELLDNAWLSGLYDNRGRWVPCFLKTTFWAGMSTTQRSESMNAFFDGYVHSRTSLKQFVEQYERALRSKVEKEVQADFRSYSQNVPCATNYEIEKHFQSVYTIAKFREVQDEFKGKVYCDLMSVSEGSSGLMYEVHEDVLYENGRKKKIVFVLLKRENCEFICSCHLFEFRGIICRHAIAVLIRNGVLQLPEQYTLRRWRKDVNRAHTRVAVNYDGLASTPGQLRYDSMCHAFAEVADLAADDEVRTRAILDWIKSQTSKLMPKKSSSACNIVSQHTMDVASQCADSQTIASDSIRDPKCIKRKGAPRRLRRKSPLELSSNKSTASLTSTKGKRPRSRKSNMEAAEPELDASKEQCSTQTPFSFSQLLLGDAGIQAFSQPLTISNVIPPLSTNVIYSTQGHPFSHYYSHMSQHGDPPF